MSKSVAAVHSPDLLPPGEKEQKERALQERLEKKAILIAGSMRKFLASYWTARQAMLEEEAIKKLVQGKKTKAKKATPDKKDKGGKGDKKKETKTPVQEAWSVFLADLDDRINKQKRFNLEDLFRGVSQLTHDEKRSFACIVVASNNKKVLPTEGMNINSLNIRGGVFAAVAAFDAPVDKSTLSASSGLALVVQRGASEEQLLKHGFKEADLLRMGCSRPDVLSLAVPHGLSNLRAAAVSVSEILAPDACGGLLDAPRQPEQTLGGCRGAAALRSAGYTVEDVASAKLHTTWDLRTAGYSLEEVSESSGASREELAASGFSDPRAQPTSLMQTAFSPGCVIDVTALHAIGKGTATSTWRHILKS